MIWYSLQTISNGLFHCSHNMSLANSVKSIISYKKFLVKKHELSPSGTTPKGDFSIYTRLDSASFRNCFGVTPYFFLKARMKCASSP